MPTIEIPKVRIEIGIRLNVGLSDSGVAVDWSGLQDIAAFFYSESQHMITGPAHAEVDGDDPENLIVTYGARQPQYLGVVKVLIRCRYHGREKTYDKAAFAFVATTAEATGVLDVDDPVVDVHLDVSEVSTSLLDDAIDAALAAAAKAEAAAAHQPVIGENRHWLVWDSEAGEYTDTGVVARGIDGDNGTTPHIGQNGHWFLGSTDTGVPARGPEGPQGPSGNLNYPTFDINGAMHLQAEALTEGDADRFDIDASGHLGLTI